MLVKNVQKLDAIVIGHDVRDLSMKKDFIQDRTFFVGNILFKLFQNCFGSREDSVNGFPYHYIILILRQKRA